MACQNNRKFKQENLPPTSMPPVRIQLSEGECITKNKPYQMNPQKEEACRIKINDMINKGHLRPSEAEGCMPVIMVPKADLAEDGSTRYRLVVDLRELNNKCVKTSKPIPSIERIFDDLSKNGKVFSILDLTDGIHQCPITEDSKHLTAIITPFGVFEYDVLPQGFTNSPGEFQLQVVDILDEAKKQGRIPLQMMS